MDIFNRKKVAELERELNKLKDENTNLKRHLEYAESELKAVVRQKESIPDSCTPGEYCNACVYAKKYEYKSYIHNCRHVIIPGIVCLKGQACPNFIQKKTEE